MDNGKKVREQVIAPMLRLYGGALSQFQTEAFIEDLGRYSETQLAAAWREVRQTCKHRPNVAHFVEAIHKATPAAPTGQPLAPQSYAWEGRDREATKLAAEYVQRYELDSLMQEANREGWGRRLWAYVIDVATLQAQFICGVSNPGLTAASLRYGTMAIEAVKQRQRRLVDECRQQAGRGVINVTVPSEAIDHWKLCWGKKA